MKITIDEEYGLFQLTRSVGSVTKDRDLATESFIISTHTLRGERDIDIQKLISYIIHFNSHAPWGA